MNKYDRITLCVTIRLPRHHQDLFSVVLIFSLVISTFDIIIITLEAIVMKHVTLKALAIALFCLEFTGLNAQKVNIDVARLFCPPPVIDGIEEEEWDAVEPVYLEYNFWTEQPTVTAYWKALWEDNFIYVFINVEDDNYYPGWEAGGNGWEYDKPEIYFDVNDVLVDGNGPATASSGHYQWSPDPTDGGDGTPTSLAGTTQAPGGTYAYIITGENWAYEFAVDVATMSKVNSDPIGCETKIGFDVTVIDQDEGITTTRQRKIWQSGDGTEAEAWNSMDSSGTITLTYFCAIFDCWDEPCDYNCGNKINDNKTVNITIQPNPVTDFLTINADYDRVIIDNILGQEILSMDHINTNKLDVGYLSKGFYILRVYKGERYIGAAKIMKN